MSASGEVEVVVEEDRGPDRARLDATVRPRHGLAEVGLAALGEGRLQLCQQFGLVAFDGEQVMRLALVDEVVGPLALGQQGVGGEGVVGDLDRVDQRDEGTDLVGLLDLAAAYRQGADFFGVSAAPL